MASRIIMMILFHLSMIKEVTACGGNPAFKLVEMCKGGSTTDSHFYLHGTPAGGVERCDCNLTITGAATSVYFTPVSVTNTAASCGGTLTLPEGSLRDCGWTSRADVFMFPGTGVVSFAYSAPDVRFCVEVRVTATVANISIKCPLSTTTSTTPSSLSTTTTQQTTTVDVISSSILTTIASHATTSPLHIFTSSSTSTPSSTKPLATFTTVLMSTKKSTTVSSSEIRSTSSPFTNTQSSTGLLIAGRVIAAILVAVIVVVLVLLIRKQRQSNYESRQTCQQSVSTQTDSGSIYEGLDLSTVAKPDTLYERIETQSAGLGMKDYYNIEMGDYCNP